ncbi:MAG TPA: transglycosylase SLT domain-containing protein [Candidatus Limnocylindria bacterium]|nr:transglycosylase SLT domain-containing protein [Candidatus Limnocylindria bacterium]
MTRLSRAAREFVPVAGCDGGAYPDDCYRRDAEVQAVRDGPCRARRLLIVADACSTFQRVRVRAALAIILLLLPRLGGSEEAAREVRVPLTVDYALLTRLTMAELRGPEREDAALWRSEDGCSVFEIAGVRVGPGDDRLEIRADGKGRAGLGLLSWCLFPVKRDAELRILATPVLGDDWQLRLTDVQATIVDKEGRSTFLMRRITGVMGESIEDAVARVVVDLTPPAADIRDVIRSSLAPAQAERATAALESLRPLGATVTPRGVRAEVGMRVPPAPPAPVGPEPALSDEERRRWEEALADWDEFLTFAVKELGLADPDRETVDALFRIFIDGRHAVLDVLAAGPRPGEDPVRPLFLSTWSRLRRIVIRVARRAPPDRRDPLLYMRFVAAGDALAALEQIGPNVGIEISADGLRRLARTLDPDTLFDPRARSEAPDPALRRLFGFHEPPSTPQPPAAPGATPPSTTPAPLVPDAASSTTPPPAAPEKQPVPPPDTVAPPPATPDAAPPHTWWRWWSIGGVAQAAERPVVPATAELDTIGRRLDHLVPEPAEMEDYRRLVSRLLDLVAALEQESEGVPAATRPLFRQLVRTTAWQESCWHQFERRGGTVVPLISRTGDVGIMQVNRRVWRGVFDAVKLERDVVYNADAGTQILAQYLLRYGMKEGRVRGGHVARATYSAYNGGPGAYTRYRTGRRATAYTRRVDAAFWTKLQVTAAGGELAHVPCPPQVR